MSVFVLIPAFKPSSELIKTIHELHALDSAINILVIDDGSGESYQHFFSDIAEIENCKVVKHATNLGKGQALKTGINWIITERINIRGIITADADGQHFPSDIMKIIQVFNKHTQCLILGVRSWGRKVPFRSIFGNIVTRYALWFFSGIKLRDTQTGLRAIPKSLAKSCLRIKSMGYEFELDMLMAAKSEDIKIIEHPIQTIYIDNNASSHFNPIKDSMKIYFVFVRYLSLSIATSLIDFLIFYLCFFYLNSIGYSMSIARSSAGIFQFFMSKTLVFRHKGDLFVSLVRFLTLVTLSGVFSYALIYFLTSKIGLPVVPAKLLAESILFFASFAIQREFIFDKRRSPVEVVE